MAARIWRYFWLTVLTVHVLLAVCWWWLQPGGFGFGHPRFWANRVGTVAVLGLSIASLWALHRERSTMLRLLLPMWPAAWGAAALAARILFPISLAWLWLVPAAAAAVFGLGVSPFWQDSSKRSRGICAGLATGSALAAAALVLTQRVQPPATHPANVNLPEFDQSASSSTVLAGAVRLEGGVLVHSFDGSITVPVSRLTLMIEPLLRFSSRSSDGCPTVLVHRDERDGPAPRYREGLRDGERFCAFAYDFRGQGPASLVVSSGGNANGVAIEAVTRLERLVYSHLNSFCDVEIRGHHRLSLEFSPCPGVPIDVHRFDYPIGRPARFAFLEEDETFRVVEASSGEKGPFHTLASGRLGRDEPLIITLHDQGRRHGRISLADWGGQADRGLSPTAGWGVPANAIEFSLSGDSPGSPASIFITLAATSVGRGWDCVGHAAGAYRNRILIERIDEAETPSGPAAQAR
jgi:hypothetical protein